MKPLNGGVDCYHTMFNTHSHTHTSGSEGCLYLGGAVVVKKIILFIHIHTYITWDMQLRRWKCTKVANSLIIS